jgi:hypothetical protein
MAIICTCAYYMTASVWPPVIVHYSAVVVYQLFLGGDSEMEKGDGSACDSCEYAQLREHRGLP